jgi:hypothetical protein
MEAKHHKFSPGRKAMTPEQGQRMTELCEQIQTETDSKNIHTLIFEFNVLLEELQRSPPARASNEAPMEKP